MCMDSLHRSAVASAIVLLTCLAISWSRSGGPCENVVLNKRGVFNRETESSGGMLAGSVKKRHVSSRCPCLDLETVRFVAGRSNHSAIKAIVDFAGRKQPTAQARDSLYSLMASEVWMELAAYAADALNDELESGDPRRKLTERIARTLKRHARLGKPELERILENEDARSDACQRIQHWLGVAPKQSDLVLAFEDSADN